MNYCFLLQHFRLREICIYGVKNKILIKYLHTNCHTPLYYPLTVRQLAISSQKSYEPMRTKDVKSALFIILQKKCHQTVNFLSHLHIFGMAETSAVDK